MPSRNRIKTYIRGAYYHIYNRGVNKRDIFLDHTDYTTFMKQADLNSHVSIVAYCLMPNHFHLLVQNGTERGIEKFMRSLGTRYAMFFNKKYNRTGHLFQERYRAALIKTDRQFATTVHYIHDNPYRDRPSTPDVYPYSSEAKHKPQEGPSHCHTNLRPVS
jgi:putative transposase